MATLSVRAGLLIALALLVPWAPRYVPAGLAAFDAVTSSPQMLLVVGVEMLIGIWIAGRDRWLGAFVIYMAVRAVFAPIEVQPFVATQMVTFGALIIVAARRIPSTWHVGVRAGLVVTALAQVVLVALQSVGLDPIWGAGAPYTTDRQLPGSIGHGNWLGVYLAIVAPLAPWAAAVMAVGVVLAQSRLGLIALVVGLGVIGLRRLGGALVAAGLVAIGFGLALMMPKPSGTWQARWDVWMLGLDLWKSHPLFGWGPNAWWLYVPSAQEAFGVVRGQAFTRAHNEYLQLLFEGGFVAVLILGLWLWDHRRAFVGPYGGSLAALAVGCLGMFPFHLAQLAVPALLVIGVSTSEEGCCGHVGG